MKIPIELEAHFGFLDLQSKQSLRLKWLPYSLDGARVFLKLCLGGSFPRIVKPFRILNK